MVLTAAAFAAESCTETLTTRSEGNSPFSLRSLSTHSNPASATSTPRRPRDTPRSTSSRAYASWSWPLCCAPSTLPAPDTTVAPVSHEARGPTKSESSSPASRAIAHIARISASVSSMMPEPCDTRCSCTPRPCASSSTASRTRGPSTLGISTRYCAPSGKRFSESGNSDRSRAGSPSPASSSLAFIYLPHIFVAEHALREGRLDVSGCVREVDAHPLPRPLGVSGLYTGQDLLVLPQGPPGAARTRRAHPAAGPQQLHYGIQHSQEHLIARAARQQRMELDVRVDVPLGRVDEGLHPGQLAAHLPHVHLPGPLGGEAGDLDLQDLAYLQQLPQRFRPDPQQQPQGVPHGVRAVPADHRAPAVLDAYEPARLQKVQRLAYHRSTDPQKPHELALGRETLPRTQPAGDDHV